MAQKNYFISFDPGKATGWATFDEEGNLTDKGIYRSLDDLKDGLQAVMLMGDQPKVFIIEDFRLFSHKAVQQSGSDMPASQAIGSIELAAAVCRAEIVKQGSDILPIGERFAGVKLPKNHDESHDIAAYVHGFYYLVKKGIKQLTV
jgi:hypothetical protein